MSMLSSINSGALPKYNIPSPMSVSTSQMGESEQGSVYNYDISVNVSGTNASPDEIANVVMSKIKMTEDRKLRSYRF